MKKVSFILLTSLFFLFLYGCANQKENSKLIVDVPNKIILYKDGVKKEIKPSDENFIKIVSLTNTRIELDKIFIVKDGVQIDNYVNEYKEKTVGLEFIYDDEQTMNIKNSQGFFPINYYRLYFNLKAEKDSECQYFQYGDKEKYIDSSRGPIKMPNDIVDIINEL